MARERTTSGAYTPIAIALHWTIAALILCQLCLGWWMNEVLGDKSPARHSVVGVHVSVGLTILILVILRIAWRLTHPAPPLPAELSAWERWLAHAVHLVFYLLMLALPLTGWALVSLGPRSIGFWGLPWPHLPGVHAVFGANPSKALRESLSHVHVFILIWIVVVNLALHVAGALKHQFDGHPVIWRITTRESPVSRAV